MLRTLLVPYLLINVSLPLFVFVLFVLLFFFFFLFIIIFLFAEELFFQLAKDYSVEEEPSGAGKC